MSLSLTWIRSEADAVPLALIMLSSPQLPLTTLREVRRHGFDYLPDPEDLALGSARLDGYSERMRRVLEAAVEVQRSGSRSALEERLRDVLSELRTTLDTADYNISNLYSLVSTFTSTVPATIVATLALVGGGAGAAALTLISVGLVLAFISGVVIFPWEFGTPTPPLRTYLALLAALPVALLAYLLHAPQPLTLSLAVGSVPAAVLHLHWSRRELKSLERAREMVRVASRAVVNPFHSLVREGLIQDPEDLLKPEWKGFARAATLGLWQVLLHGGYENLHKLEEYTSQILEFVKRLRSKTRVFMVYTLIEAGIVGAIYAVVLATSALFAGGGEWLSRAGISSAGLLELQQLIDPVLALTSLTLAAATAGAREGRPHLLTIYLPITAGAVWLFYTAASALAPSLFG
ncbi:hypothetical protein MA03_07240 [Infirmifilum uzonense]|uniref:Type II secretion system protein GspF domain-containing protein n=1 Tax=Infirmifilum uzonense TaxID=1550241 RepID=A0A0F7FIA5_9CREN|nr:hypothetical protein [Infirmifilum uzonense]AKG39074.1 hypothetical protein MA03_07240 [Infirmifilum uzonense]